MAPTTSSARVAVSVRSRLILSARASGLGAERWRSLDCDGAVRVRGRCLAKVITHALVVRGDHLQTPIFGLTPPPIVDVAWDLDHRLFQHRPQGLCRGEAVRQFPRAINGKCHRAADVVGHTARCGCCLMRTRSPQWSAHEDGVGAGRPASASPDPLPALTAT